MMKETVINSLTRKLLFITLIVVFSQVFLPSAFLPTVSALYSNNLGFNPYIVEYDKLNYIHGPSRQKRSAISDSERVTFESHGRRFDLRLKRSSSAGEHQFASGNIEMGVTRPLDSLVTLYTGYLVDEPHDSFASGALIDGAFYGTIRTHDGHKYFVEAARKFNRTLEAHSIVYREHDLRLNNTQLKQYKRDLDQMRRRQMRSSSHAHEQDHDLDPDVGCASDNSKVKDWMRKEQEALYNERIQTQGYDQYSYTEDPYYKYSKEANEPYSIKTSDKSRVKRDSQAKKEPERVKFPGEKTICNLYLRVDPYLHTEIFNNEGNKDLDKTTAFILFYLNKHVEALNSIYNSLPFYDASKDRYLVGVQFMIYRTKIITEEQCRNKTVLTAEELKLCEPYLDVSTFLNYVSLDNFTDYCLAYTFTARDFTDGTLGLAWVAKLSGSVGGVCEKRQTLQGVAKSLNSGIVTVVNYQARVPEAVSQITFAHEVGHNFGSEHDPDDTLCSPGAQKGGNFIMYRRATTGTDRNNRNFSDCSRDQMGPILHALVSGSKFCFKQYNGSLCGNGIVEEGEECDCGYGTDCKESCCIDASQDINKCKLKPGKQCSPSQGPCCDSQCNFATAQTVCMHSTECLENVMCSGRNATCPHNDPTYFKPDKTECNSGTQVCKSGICSGSICEKYEMQQCFLEGNLKDKKQDKAVLCHLACIGEKTNNMCMDSFEIAEMIQPNATKGLILKPGSPCVGTLGYCDIFSKCRAVDAEGPLARLKNILLNPETLLTIRDWITTYWWAALLIGIGFIIFMAIFLKVCSVHTPSSNPRKPPALKITETLRRPIKKLPHIPHPHFRHHHGEGGITSAAITSTHNESRSNKARQGRSQSSGNKSSMPQQQQRRTSADKHESRSKSKNDRKNSSEIIELNKSKHQNKIKETSTSQKQTSPVDREEERVIRGAKRHLFNKRRHQYIDNSHEEPNHTSHSHHQSSSHHSHLNHHNYHHSRLSDQKRTRQSKSADATASKSTRVNESSSSRAVKSATKSKSPANHRSNHHQQQQHRLKTSDFISKPNVAVSSSNHNHQSHHLSRVAKARKRSSTESSSIDT